MKTVLRWSARVSGLLIACFYVLMIVGEIRHPHSGSPATLLEWVGIALMAATCAGMLIAWRWQLAGAILSLASLVAFVILIRLRYYAVPLISAIPGILFLADWLVRRHRTLGPSA